MPSLGVGDVAEVDVPEVPDGQVAVNVVENGTAYKRADVAEADTAVHGDVAHVWVIKGLDDGVDDGAEDDGDVCSSRTTINISNILMNLAQESYTTVRSSSSLNNISALSLRRWPMHSHTHSYLTTRRSSSSTNRRDCRGRHFNVSLRRHLLAAMGALQDRNPWSVTRLCRHRNMTSETPS